MKPINIYECEQMHCLECDFSDIMFNKIFRLDKDMCDQRKIFRTCLENQRKVFIDNRNKLK